MPRPRILLTAAVTAALCVVGTAVVAAPASAAPTGTLVPAKPPVADRLTPNGATTGRTPADTQLDLTVVLRPTDEAALRALPSTVSGRSVLDRARAIAGLAPALAQRATVRSALVAAGFTVTDAGSWQLDARGSAASAEALFGVTLVGTGTGVHPTSAPVMPAVFRGAATTVLGLDLRPALTSSVVPGGWGPDDLASAYAATGGPAAGAGATIATVQFSGWDRNDLASYAAASGRPIPAVDEVAVDGADPRKFDGGGGETEVALDQEALFATAPAARQRVYIAPNSGLGAYDAYDRIAQDVQSAGITAVSISWGFCEPDLTPQTRSVLDTAIARIVAAGATVFAASGDSGSSCTTSAGKTVTGVTYPASSPSVVGVGGTSLTRSGSRWSETAWSNQYGSSGGGTSAFAIPSWQSSAGIAGSNRMVPDIAGVADPATGPGIFFGTARGWALGGGTSLSSPVAAGQFAAALAGRGCTVGVGDVHAALYANRSAFRDVTSGSNGAYRAGVGYDAVTGLGSPNWSALASVLPTASGCTTQTAPVAADGTRITASSRVWAAGTSIHSPNGQFWLSLQADGNLVEYGNGRVLWQTNTRGNTGATLAVRTTGDAVVTSASGQVLWHTGTTGSGNALTVTDGGDVQVAAGTVVRWHNRAPGANVLTPGGSLAPGQTLWDTTGKNRLVMRGDGVLVVYVGSVRRWAAIGGTRGSTMRMQTDGNVVLYDVYGRPKWASNTSRYKGTGMQLTAGTDGNVVLRQNGVVRWQSGTVR